MFCYQDANFFRDDIMKSRFFLSACALAASALTAPSAYATGYLTGQLGWYDFIDSDNQAASFGAEYRFEPFEYSIRPMVGAFATTDGAVYGYGGLHWDIEVIANTFYISPNFAAGLYANGDGKDLGGAIQFRSGLELEYQMANQHRIGLAINHISNASIYDKNPGEETLLLNYSIPTGK